MLEERSLLFLATMYAKTADWGVSKDYFVSTSHVAEGVLGLYILAPISSFPGFLGPNPYPHVCVEVL